MWSLSACQGSQCCYLTSGIGPTGNVLGGFGLWEFCGRFDSDREQQFGKAAVSWSSSTERPGGLSLSDDRPNEGGVVLLFFVQREN